MNEYVSLTSLCMKYNCFQSTNQSYNDKEETALSPFLVKLFMSRFNHETSQEQQNFPLRWITYDDHIFTIFDNKKSDVEDFIPNFNNPIPTINLLPTKKIIKIIHLLKRTSSNT